MVLLSWSYAVATLLYLPITLYAGHARTISIFELLRDVVFDGTFYHLWYLPASILGTLLLFALSRKLRFGALFPISLALYAIGLLGDSYFGAVAQVPAFASFYRVMFGVFSFTRNGLFYSPIFLAIGAWFGQKRQLAPKRRLWVGLAVSLGLMIAEGLMLRRLQWSRHDSMYLLLPVCAYFLFALLVSARSKSSRTLRSLATWIYLLHPLSIVMIRGLAKATKTVPLFVENSLVHFLAVVLLTVLLSFVVVRLTSLFSRKRFAQGRAWIELDRSVLRQNVSALTLRMQAGCRLMAVIKANAYGHGAVLIARELYSLGIRSFCVASVSEGVTLRKHGIRGEILVLGYTHSAQFDLLRRYRLTQSVIDAAYARQLHEYGKIVSVQIALDSGMHRLGERCEQIDEIKQLFQYRNLKIKGLYSHLCADDGASPAEQAFTRKQAQDFFHTADLLREAGCSFPDIHLQASYGLLNYPELSGTCARVGIALYGMLGTNEDTRQCRIALKPVLSLKARVALIRDIREGETVGYSLMHVAKRDSRIAVLTIGYADGLPRALSCGTGSVLIRGHRAPIIGCICMDQTLIDITDIPDVSLGDCAVLIGRSGDLEISACDLAEQTGTISNEILSRLGERLERIVVSSD